MPKFSADKFLSPYSGKWFASKGKNWYLIGLIEIHETMIDSSDMGKPFHTRHTKKAFGYVDGKIIKKRNLKDETFTINPSTDFIDKPKNYHYEMVKLIFK